ncbi:MAG: hypothetical protein CL910_03665 [Deltaproteobacteria bacterium]|nr:hypothetical protein [Deltaproteobacteria bacterium]
MSEESHRPAIHDVRRALLGLREPLDLLAEDVLGLGARIDWVARDPLGGVTLVRWAAAGEDLAALADLVAQRAWLAPRLPDWHQLAPERQIDPERAPSGLVLGLRFDPRTSAAAAALAPPIEVGRWMHIDGKPRIWLENGPEPWDEPAEREGDTEARSPVLSRADGPSSSSPPAEGLVSRFRTLLLDGDL